MKLAEVLGWINTRVILGAVFYLVVTPIGAVRRLLGKDPMGTKSKSAIESYRILRKPRSASHLKRQYWRFRVFAKEFFFDAKTVPRINSLTEASQMGEFLIELWSFMKERKKFWLLPIVLCLVLLGSLIVFTSGSAVAPFIYTLF
jgi:Family of unknown function (DUF5989)/Saxitoxin biosynthesis operon protein SxtJ